MRVCEALATMASHTTRVRSRNLLLFLLPLLIQLLYPTAVAAKPNIVSVGLYVTTVGDVSCGTFTRKHFLPQARTVPAPATTLLLHTLESHQ